MVSQHMEMFSTVECHYWIYVQGAYILEEEMHFFLYVSLYFMLHPYAKDMLCINLTNENVNVNMQIW